MFHPFRTEYILDRRSVKVEPEGLYVERDAQFLRARDCGAVRKVAVSHRKPAAGDGVFAVSTLIGVEQGVRRATAGGVRGHLPAQIIGRASHLRQVFARNGEHASILRVHEAVYLRMDSVRFTQVRGTNQNSAVRDRLQATDAQPIVAPSGDEWNSLNLVPNLCRCTLRLNQISNVASGSQLAGFAEALISAESLW